MKENSIEEDIKLLEELDWLYLDKPEIICDRYEEATNHILSDYKRVLKENAKYKKLVKINLKNAKEFENNMCEHRCLLKSENEERKKLIERMKRFLLKENKMRDYLDFQESEK